MIGYFRAMLKAPSAGHVSLKHPPEAIGGFEAGRCFGLLTAAVLGRGTREVLAPKAPTPSSSLHIPEVAEIQMTLLHG